MDKKQSRRTPYNPEYGTCELSYAKLKIYPGEMDPDEVSKRLELEPTSTQKSGEVWISSRGIEKVYQISGWFLSSENKVSSKDIRDHLDWLLDLLIPKLKVFEDLQKQPNLTMSMDCVWWSAQGQGGPTLWPEQMQRMAELNLECSFDIYFLGEE